MVKCLEQYKRWGTAEQHFEAELSSILRVTYKQ